MSKRPVLPLLLRSVLIAATLALAAPFASAQDSDSAQNADPAQNADSGLDEATLYELLVGEIALQRGDAPLAARTYAELARTTRDPRIVRRAIEVANYARQPELALESAKLWAEIEPTSPQPLQIIAALLISAKRIDDAEPYLEKLLAADGVNLENGYLQLNRLLSGNPDKAANLRVVRQLAAKHPELAQAHVATAQAALAAGEDALALGEFVDKYPNAREARLNYARALVLDKRFAEARKQFEAVLAASPGNADAVY